MPKASHPSGPPEETASARERIAEAVREAPLTAREISARASVSEKEVAGHLEHLARSARAHGERLEVEPAACLACGFTFRTRERLSTPGRCPQCRSERIRPARFSLST